MGDSSTPAAIRVICGPTASGKTAFAVACSRFADVSVVSADSRQVYRGFDIGTAKPTPRDLLAAPHYGIDVLDPTERASAAWWADRADQWIDEIAAQGRTPIVVGGTGLYLRALFGTLFEEPPMHQGDRLAIQAALADHSTEELRRWVTTLDPPRAHLGRTQLLRAIEVALLTGRRMSDLHAENARAPRRRARYLVLDAGPSLRWIIEERVRRMLSSGWHEEVRWLMERVPSSAPAWNASGYGTIREFVEGRVTLAEAEARIIIETRQYAKRQRTWFRHQLDGEDVTRLDMDSDPEAVLTAWFNEEKGE